MLGYSQWRRFEDAVKRAMTSCEASGNTAGHHFAGAGTMIEVGKDAIKTTILPTAAKWSVNGVSG